MKDLTTRALDTVRSRGAAYADVRVIHSRRESIAVKNSTVEALSLNEDQGFGIRALGACASGSSAELLRGVASSPLARVNSLSDWRMAT